MYIFWRTLSGPEGTYLPTLWLQSLWKRDVGYFIRWVDICVVRRNLVPDSVLASLYGPCSGVRG